jgi:hypothetical protein
MFCGHPVDYCAAVCSSENKYIAFLMELRNIRMQYKLNSNKTLNGDCIGLVFHLIEETNCITAQCEKTKHFTSHGWLCWKYRHITTQP